MAVRAKPKFDAVIARDVFGNPVALPIVVYKAFGRTTVYAVLSFEQRRDLDAIHDAMVGKREGLAWTGPTFLVRDRRYEGGVEISLEEARGGWLNAETQAVDVGNIVGKLPETIFDDETLNPKPAGNMNWREATLMTLVRLASEKTK